MPCAASHLKRVPHAWRTREDPLAEIWPKAQEMLGGVSPGGGGGGGGKTFAEVPAAGAGLAAGAWAGKEEYDAFLVKVLEVANRRRTKRLGEELAAMPECGKP